MAWFTPVAGGVEIDVLAVPRSSRSRVTGIHDDCLKVQLAAPPADGAANQALVELIAALLGVRRSDVSIVSGHGHRRKRVRVAGVSAAQVEALGAA